MELGAYSICWRFKNSEESLIQIFSGMHGLVQSGEREDFWTEMYDIRGPWNDPWYIGGDFNIVANEELPKKFSSNVTFLSLN